MLEPFDRPARLAQSAGCDHSPLSCINRPRLARVEDRNSRRESRGAWAVSRNGRSDSASFYISRAILHGSENHQELARAYFDSAVRVPEVRQESGPAMLSSHAQLGLVPAGLGGAEDAVGEGKVAVELLPLLFIKYPGDVSDPIN